ncbi:hypothetical protein B296_00026306 [Ensete ventricosum]|uniref:Uncharacterized protein n=1 Tax=Ensete ventricosum TaxID=4639 RepID=A0A427A4G3_ENSVE|nr:hypothetical protein B296_00026306 [Ensete ventricosum]
MSYGRSHTPQSSCGTTLEAVNGEQPQSGSSVGLVFQHNHRTGETRLSFVHHMVPHKQPALEQRESGDFRGGGNSHDTGPVLFPQISIPGNADSVRATPRPRPPTSGQPRREPATYLRRGDTAA